MYNKNLNEVKDLLQTNFSRGLSSIEALKRLNEEGLNALEEAKRKPLIVRFLEQFKDVLVVILIIAAVISVVVDPAEWAEACIIFLVVILNAVLGVVQESRAEKSLDALKKLSTPVCKVIRDGQNITIDSTKLVCGDIILVEAGDFIPADARIIESYNLKVDEAALTGESVPVEKSEKIIKEAKALGDMQNMLYSSTYATYGRAKAVIVSTGMNTEIGKIAKMLNSEENKSTPLQAKLAQIGKIMGILSIAICVIVFIVQIINFAISDKLGWPSILEAFELAVALAVAAIPEGLATVVTIVLSLGVKKMVKRNAIVKKLPAVETLGCTSVVCSDKTGTLTQNKMTVVEYFDRKTHILKTTNEKSNLLSYIALCCDAKINIVDGKEVRIGDPTETALIEANNIAGGFDISDIKRVNEIAFDSDRKLMTVVVELNGKLISITKGAPDKIFELCTNDTSEAVKINKDMASRALRVLGVGIKEVSYNTKTSELEKNLNFIGLVGMIDPERAEVKDAVALAKKAGIKTVMITGDHVVTAEAIAKNLGIFSEGDIAITSADLAKMSDKELDEKLEKISVFARVAPSDKVRIVKAWQAKGKVVSMTGDGVNDSPALKAADIGCAMGITGTDVSKEAAAMILVDDNFSTIINAVQEGRNVYANIKKCVKYLLSSNIGEVLTIFTVSIISIVATFLSPDDTPLLPIHLLWINLITDSLPAFALGMEESGPELMDDSPRPKNESFFANHLGLHIFLEGIFIGGLTLVAFFIGLNFNGPINQTSPEQHAVQLQLAQTMAFITLSTLQLFHAFNVKSDKTIFNKRLFNNIWLWGAFAVGIILELCVLYLPGINDLFNLTPLTVSQLSICLGLSFSIIIIMEIYKLFNLLMKKETENNPLK